jgi:hypothetical protein
MAQRNEEIEPIRKRIVHGLTRELVSLRAWLSGVAGNSERVEMLRGERGEEILAKCADTLMTELGCGVDEPPTSKNSKIRRAARERMGLSTKDATSET